VARPARRALGVALAAALALGAAGAARAQGVAGTDIARVDQFIDAPRAIFGRTRADVERALGATADPDAREVRRPGVTLRFRPRGALERVRITAPRFGLPLGLDIGAPREAIGRVLGEPQAEDDARVMYLYSDGYPDTVEFYFAGGRVSRIDWTYWPH
jgi:hypothetical protein